MLNDIIVGIAVIAVMIFLVAGTIWSVRDLRAHDPKNKPESTK
jgi:hypothetical protein